MSETCGLPACLHADLAKWIVFCSLQRTLFSFDYRFSIGVLQRINKIEADSKSTGLRNPTGMFPPSLAFFFFLTVHFTRESDQPAAKVGPQTSTPLGKVLL